MLTKSVVFLAFLATTLAGRVPYQNIQTFGQGNSRIVGGTTATAGQFPYQALFRTYDVDGFYSYCGGSIVSDRWIITAGHCTYDTTPDAVYVVVGRLYLSSGGTTMLVQKLLLHPNFNITEWVNDISLVKTVDPIVFTPTVQPIGIGSTDKIPGNVPATVSGWGDTSWQGVSADTLQYLNVITLFTDDCRLNSLDVGAVHANTICTLKASGSGFCQGDSGGPLVANGQLIGVVSNAFDCAAGIPDIYARVSSHYDWIMKKIAE